MTFDESIGVAISSMSSYGFGLGSYGPSGNFASLNLFSKYYLSFLMIAGRLEVFTVLSLFFLFQGKHGGNYNIHTNSEECDPFWSGSDIHVTADDNQDEHTSL